MNLRFGKYNSESCRTYRYLTKLRSPLGSFAIHLRFHYEPRGRLDIPITRVGVLVQEVANTRRLLPSKATVLRARWVPSYEEYVLAHYCRGAPDILNDGVMLANRTVNFERKRGKYQYFHKVIAISRLSVSVLLRAVPLKGVSYSGYMMIACGRGTWLLALLR